jgi:hypothetical protein
MSKKKYKIRFCYHFFPVIMPFFTSFDHVRTRFSADFSLFLYLMSVFLCTYMLELLFRVIKLWHELDEVLMVNVKRCFNPPTGWGQRGLLQLLISKIYCLIQKNPYVNPLPFYLLAFYCLANIEGDESFNPDTRTDWNFITDKKMWYSLPRNDPNLKTQKIPDNVFFFAIGGNNCRAAWWKISATMPHLLHECPVQMGHGFIGLNRSQAQLVSSIHFFYVFMYYLTSDFVFFHIYCS